MSAAPSADTGRISDLTVVFGLIITTPVVLLFPGFPQPIEWAFGIPFLLVVPGYALAAALFAGDPRGFRSGSADGELPGWAAKVAIALVTSALLVAVVGVTLAAVGSLQLTPTVLILAGISLGFAILARFRRRRFRSTTPYPTESSSGSPQKSVMFGKSGLQKVSLAVAIVVLLGALTFAGTTASGQSPYSEATLLGSEAQDLLEETETTFVAGEENTLGLALANHEGTPVEYEFVGKVQRVGPDGTVLEEERVDTASRQLAHNESVVVERTIVPSVTGENLRLQYLVYKGGAPADPTRENADLSLRVWIDVVDGESS